MSDDFVKPVKTLDEIELEQDQLLSKTPRSPEFQYVPQKLEMEPSLIDNTNKNFKGQQKNEIVHCFSRRHWIVLLPHFIGFFILATAIAGFFIIAYSVNFSQIMDTVTYRAAAVFGLIALTYYMHRFFLRIFNYYLQIFIITNFRVVILDQTLFLHRNRDSIDLPEIQDTVIHQSGIIKSIFNYGEIIITLSSVHSSKTLSCVPNPEYYFRKINKIKREYITSRRLAKAASQ